MVNVEELLDALLVPPAKQIDLRRDYDPGFTGHWVKKQEAKETLAQGIKQLADLQEKLYAQDSYAVLMILQGLDASGKDSAIKHIMSGVNPQGVNVHSFKAPSQEELDHDYLWRIVAALPRRGQIGVLNRSYYEEVTVVRVHPEFLEKQKLPPALVDDNIWNRRFEEINHFEKYLVNNGIVVLKFFLNVSKEEQKQRFLKRLMHPEKHWKFDRADLEERQHWDDYIAAYEDMINHTSTPWAPWYVVPADHKWFTRLAIAAVLQHTLEQLHLAYPTVSESQRSALHAARIELENEASSNGKSAAERESQAVGHSPPHDDLARSANDLQEDG